MISTRKFRVPDGVDTDDPAETVPIPTAGGRTAAVS